MKHSDYLKKKKIRETRKKIISVISAIVVFITTYALVLPAITLDVSKASQEPGIAYEQMQFKATAAAASVTAADSTEEEAQVEEPAAEEPEEEPAEEVKEEEPAETPEEEASAVSAEEEKEEEPVEEAPAEPEQEEAPAQEAPEVQEDKGQADSADEKSSESAPAEAEAADTQKAAEDAAVDQTGTDAAEAAAAATTEEAAPEFKIPELDALDFDDILTGKTNFYYYHVEDAEEAEEISSDSIDDWKKVNSDTVLAPEDFVRVYLSYEIPAGALNETNAVARYTLPADLELSDKQIKAINKYENGIAASKSGSERDKYLGAEAIEGSRTPDEKADDEYIAATVKVKKTDSGRQELVFTFIPYTVEKNQISYDEKGEVKSKGKEVKGFFTFDLKTSQIDFEKTNIETVEKEDGTTEEIQYSEAKFVFADEDSNWIERALTLAAPVEKEEAREPKTLTREGADYTVIVSYTDEAQIPDNAELTVREIEKETEEYESYLEQAKGAVENTKSVNEARFFDITIVADGEKVEPQAPVSVQINFAGIEQTNTDDTQLLHYKDSEDVEVMDKAEFSKSDEQIVDTVQFETEGFSVYGIVGTETISAPFTASDGNTYEVTVNYGKEAGIPEGAKLKVSEVTAADGKYDEYVAQTADAINVTTDSLSYIKLLDISILDASGETIVLNAPVNVEIKLLDQVKAEETTQVVHFEGEREIPVIMEREVLGDTVNFSTDGFSVYAIVNGDQSNPNTYSYKYVFHDVNGDEYSFVNKEGESTTFQRVGNNEVLYNPGVPNEEVDGKQFMGWYEKDGDNWASEATLGVYEESKTITGVTSFRTIDLYAKYDDAYFLEYFDGTRGVVYRTEASIDGDFTVSSSKTATLMNGDTTRVSYQPDNSDYAFLGWSLTHDAGTYYTSNLDNIITTVDFTGDEDRKIELYPVMAEVYWITFDKNDWVYTESEDGSYILVDGKYVYTDAAPAEGENRYTRSGTGATYVAPLWVLKTDTSVSQRHPEIPESTRPGYVFNGWLDENGNQFNPSQRLTSNITLTADWVAADTNYTVIFWRQNATDAVDATDAQKTYSYDGSSSRDALTGTTVSTTNADRTGYGTGFKYNSNKSDTSATVAADGSTVLNVYYDRQDYTLTFQRQSGGWWVNDNSLTIHELYGHAIADQFTGERWLDYQGVKYATNKVLVMIDIMPNANITFRYSDPGSRPTKHMYYMVEALPGTSGTSSYTYRNESRNFIQYAKIDARYNQVTENEDFMDLEGFTKWTSNPRFQNGVALNDSYRDGTIYMYYTRNSYNLEFWDSYDNTQIAGTSGYESVLYQAPLANYANVVTVADDSTSITYKGSTVSHEGYKFDGWYADSECTQPFDFTSESAIMPSHPVKVYAKWSPLRFRVWVQPNGGVLSSSESTFFRANWGELIQEYADVEQTGRNYYQDDANGTYYYINIADPTNYDGARVAYYVPISEASTAKEFYDSEGHLVATVNETTMNDGHKYVQQDGVYEFVGWYKVALDEVSDNVNPPINVNDPLEAWSFNTPIKENTVIRAIWKRLGRFAARYDANMYADDGSTVVVPAAEDTVVPPDTEFAYGDLANAITGFAPTVIPEGYTFAGWKTPIGEIVQPNEIFTIYANYAVQNPDVHTEEDDYYWYTLTAVYKQIDTTSITYDANGGSGTLTDLNNTQTLTDSTLIIAGNTVSNIKINSDVNLSSGDGFKRDGYVLIGWNDDQTAASNGDVKFELGQTYAVGADSTLYAVWQKLVLDIEFYKYGEQVTGEEQALSGVAFALQKHDGTSVQSVTSGTDGKVTFQRLEPDVDSYALVETTPTGYKELDGEFIVTYEPKTNADGSYVTDGDKIIGKAIISYNGSEEGIVTTGLGDNADAYVIHNKKQKTDITIHKVDDKGADLDGAQFTLTIKDGGVDKIISRSITDDSGETTIIVDENGNFTAGTITIPDLYDGEYSLSEVPPSGYVYITPITFTVQDGKIVSVSGSSAEKENDTTLKVINTPGKELPMTGGSGTLPYTLSGIALMLGAALMYGFRMRRRERRLN